MLNEPLSRRGFARQMALGAGIVAVPNVVAEAAGLADQTPRHAEPSLPPAPEDLQLAALLQQYPSQHLTAEMLAGIRASLVRNRLQAEELRSVTLDNSDAPALLFRAYRKE